MSEGNQVEGDDEWWLWWDVWDDGRKYREMGEWQGFRWRYLLMLYPDWC